MNDKFVDRKTAVSHTWLRCVRGYHSSDNVMVPAVKAHNRYKTGCRSRQSCHGICFSYRDR